MKRYWLAIAATLLLTAPALAGAPRSDDHEPLLKQLSNKNGRYVERAWSQKTQRVKRARERYLAEMRRDGIAPVGPLPNSMQVGDTLRVPVLCGYFLGQSIPYAPSVLQDQLFDNNPGGTVTSFWNAASYGALAVTGDVNGWTQTLNVSAYYGGVENGTNPATDRLGEFVKEMLDTNDSAVDFGLYDNDGPDGIPNSGDDDGFVDILCVVHNRTGGECGNANIWSHYNLYSAWNVSGGLPYSTNDASNAPGISNILVNDFVVAPAHNCDGATTIDIGLFCHFFGRGLGLPALYDARDFRGDDLLVGNGIGEWGIMGRGYLSTSDTPNLPSAWTRVEMGWVTPTDVGWSTTPISLDDINSGAEALRLAFTNDRFRRSTVCAISGLYSLYCGLSTAEGVARGWVAPDSGDGGYGPNWVETVEREFTFDGSGPVTLTYDFAYDVEAGYDFAYTIIDIQGVETVLASYSGTFASDASIDLTPHLGALGPGDNYSIEFRVETDFSFDNGDGLNPSKCGAFAVDNIAVTGGGENYSTDFESLADGWHQDADPADNPVTEYWLVENRQATGFDAGLPGDGLLVWHVEEELLHAPFFENRGGPLGTGVRGLVLEEADGQFNLNSMPFNLGDDGDPFPGSTTNTTFDGGSIPNSDDNTGNSTLVAITSIGPSGPTVTLDVRAGDTAPQTSAASPNTFDNDVVTLDMTVTGDFIKAGATFYFTNPSAAQSAYRDGQDIVATSLRWDDPTQIRGTINPYSKTGGLWDLVVTNPDGQTVTLQEAILINQIVATRLVSASVTVIDGAVRLAYRLHDTEEGERLRITRSLLADGIWREIEGDLRPDYDDVHTFVDGDVEPGRTYYYLLESRMPDGDVFELHRASATIPSRETSLGQNYPNPFNPATTINFYLPGRRDVVLDIYDVNGALVRRLARGRFDVGAHVVEWDGADGSGNAVSSGVYLYRLRAGNRVFTKKMMLLK